MSGDTAFVAPRKHNVAPMRVHDYLYDSAYIVSGAKDFARTAFKAAMASAQVGIQPVYNTMFSELRSFPRAQFVYHPNCRLPRHMDRSYTAYLARVSSHNMPAAQCTGRDRFKYAARPMKVLELKSATPDFHPPTPRCTSVLPGKPRNRATQSLYRESSAQTQPWQPDAKVDEGCETKPEVLYLDKFEWGPGNPYRSGDLPADFHTTEIINKMRHSRVWTEVVEEGRYPRWMKSTDAIISDIETKDWIFREAEIDELQDIRLNLLHRLQSKAREKNTTRAGRKLAKLWDAKKREMERKVENIRHNRDRELRKLSAIHGSGGRPGQVAKMRAARGHGSMITAARDPTSDLYAPVARHGYQARRRHAEITYDPSLLSLEDHKYIAEPPAWLHKCGQDLTKSCSGHHLRTKTTQLCERETKWSEQFLESLHDDLKKARLGAARNTVGALHVLKPLAVSNTQRPSTPSVESVWDAEEVTHQCTLTLQRTVRGRAVQTLMYEGRTRAAELTEELSTTHGLQKEDRVIIAKEEARAREYNALKTDTEQKEDAISAVVEELCGGAVSHALDFLEKELRRLKDERRHHAFILIALREKTMREAAEAGRRQKEEHRRREHDEMFKQVVGVTQHTVDAYLQEIIDSGVELAAERDAVRAALVQVDNITAQLVQHGSVSTAEQHECVAELVQQYLLPSVHRQATRRRMSAVQDARLRAARDAIFDVVDTSEVVPRSCTQCGELNGQCRCTVCPHEEQRPVETEARDDIRWKKGAARPSTPSKTLEQRYPPQHDIRCMLNVLLDEAVQKSREDRSEREWIVRDIQHSLRDKLEAAIDAKEIVQYVLDDATGYLDKPIRDTNYRHTSKRIIVDALGKSEPFDDPSKCPKLLPSELRRREEALKVLDKTCHCDEPDTKTKENIHKDYLSEEKNLLPSEVRAWEEMRRCKCDAHTLSPDSHTLTDTDEETMFNTTGEETTEFDTDEN